MFVCVCVCVCVCVQHPAETGKPQSVSRSSRLRQRSTSNSAGAAARSRDHSATIKGVDYIRVHPQSKSAATSPVTVAPSPAAADDIPYVVQRVLWRGFFCRIFEASF